MQDHVSAVNKVLPYLNQLPLRLQLFLDLTCKFILLEKSIRVLGTIILQKISFINLLLNKFIGVLQKSFSLYMIKCFYSFARFSNIDKFISYSAKMLKSVNRILFFTNNNKINPVGRYFT